MSTARMINWQAFAWAMTAKSFNELGVVTIRNAADMGYFSEEFINAIAMHRHWTRQKELVPA